MLTGRACTWCLRCSQIPDSTRLWTAAAALESDKAAQLRVLKKALERVPYSVSLWKHAIELVDEEDAKVCCWLRVKGMRLHVGWVVLLWRHVIALADEDIANEDVQDDAKVGEGLWVAG